MYKIWTGENYKVRMGMYRAVIRVLRVREDPAFGALLTYRFVGKSGTAQGPEWCWPISWFNDFEIPLHLLAKTTLAEQHLAEVDRDDLTSWWGSLLGSPTVPQWIAQEQRGPGYPG